MQGGTFFRSKEIYSGFMVFLIALPLCVGISIASGAPPTAGIIAAIVGGIVGSFISGSYLTINGPAAGLIVVVLAAVDELGRGDAMAGYKLMLACAVIAGLIQIVLGLFKAGGIGLAFPSAVVHGMMSAIGLIIISKQSHLILGVTPEQKNPLGLFAEIPHSLWHLNPAVAAIGVLSLVTILVLSELKWKFLKRIPAALVVVLLGVGLGKWFDLDHEHTVHALNATFSLGPRFLLDVPTNIVGALHFPDFRLVASWLTWKHALVIAFVASIESILSAVAVDSLDPQRRRSDLNKELIGKGSCNVLSGMMGGLPIIAEILRSTANVKNGASNQWSNFFHGVFLLIFIVTMPHFLHAIPLAALAAILLYVGFHLARPAHFFHAQEKGFSHGLVFLGTILAILATDLLVGVLLGAALEFVVVAVRGRTLNIFNAFTHRSNSGGKTVIRVHGPVAFTNYLSLQRQIEFSRSENHVCVDLSAATVIDHTVMEHLSRHVTDFDNRGLVLDLVFSEQHRSVSKHPLSMRILAAHDKLETVGNSITRNRVH